MNIADNDKPPFFRKWSGWYISLVIFLVVIVLLFSLFTKYFS